MEPVLRIAGHGALTITVTAAREQADRLLHLIQSIPNGADIQSAPPSFSARDRAGTDLRELSISGTPGQLRQLARGVASTPDPVSRHLLKKIDCLLDNYRRSDYKIECRGKVLDLGTRTHIMGILNVTPDSFSDGGLFSDFERALAHAREMVAAGADILDIGGESTRPGAAPLSEQEELRRIIPLIERLAAELSVPLSVDTYKSAVARRALEAGASIINDISGLRFSPDMAAVAAEFGAGLVIMHIKGTPRDMQQNPIYDDLIFEILSYLDEGIAMAERAGVNRETVLVDPGIGFGKTLEHNLTILNRLDELRALGRPIVLGTSRKKFIGTILGIGQPDQRMEGTASTVTIGIQHGASVVRVHDVAAMSRVVRMTDAIVKRQVPDSKYQIINKRQ